MFFVARRNIPDDRLAALIHMHMLDADELRATLAHCRRFTRPRYFRGGRLLAALGQRPGCPQQCRDFTPALDRFRCIAAMLVGIPITFWCSRRHPAVQSAAAVRHRR